MRQRNRRAFSMIEVLIALALLIVVAMISMPMFASRMDEARAEGATSQVQVALSQARSEAQESGLPIRVVAVVNEDGKTNIRAEAVEHGSGQGDRMGAVGGDGQVSSFLSGGEGRSGSTSRFGSGLMPGGFDGHVGGTDFGGASGGRFSSGGDSRDGGLDGGLGGGLGGGLDQGSPWAGNSERGLARGGRTISLPTGFMIASDESAQRMFDEAPRSMGGMPAPSWASTKTESTEPRTLVIFLPDGTAISAGPIKVRNRAGLGGELLVNPLTGVAVLADARSAAGTDLGNASAGRDDAELIDPFR